MDDEKQLNAEKNRILDDFENDTKQFIKHIVRHYSLQVFFLKNYSVYFPDKITPEVQKPFELKGVVYHPYRPTIQWPYGWFVNVNELKEDFTILTWFIDTCIENKIKYIKNKLNKLKYPNHHILFKFLKNDKYYLIIALASLVLQSTAEDVFINTRLQYYCAAVKTSFERHFHCDKDKIKKYTWYIFENLLDFQTCSQYRGGPDPPAEKMFAPIWDQQTYGQATSDPPPEQMPIPKNWREKLSEMFKPKARYGVARYGVAGHRVVRKTNKRKNNKTNKINRKIKSNRI